MKISDEHLAAKKIRQRLAGATALLARDRFDDITRYKLGNALEELQNVPVRKMLHEYVEMDFATPTTLLRLLGEYVDTFEN